MSLLATAEATEVFRRHHGILRTSQALAAGLPPRQLYAMRDAGQLVQLSRGVFRLADLPPLAHEDLVQVAVRVRLGVICLLSALDFHHLTSHSPHAVFVALPNRAETPRLAYPPMRFIWLTRRSYEAGIETHVLDGVPVRIYGPAKTVADCFKFRNKIGLDVALEALKEALVLRRCTPSDIMEFARVDRVERVVRSYVEALT